MYRRRYKTLIRTIPLLLLSALMSTACAGPRQDNAETISQAIPSKSLTASGEYVPIASWDVSGIDLHTAHKLMGDTLYYMTGTWNPGGGGYAEASVRVRWPDGGTETLVTIDGEDARLILYLVDESQNLHYLHSVGNEYFWTKLSPGGQVLSETAIAPPSGGSAREAFSRLGSSFLAEADRDGRMAVANMHGDLYLFDETGQLSATGSTGWDESTYSVQEYGLANAGGQGILAYHISGSVISLQQIDMAKGILKDAVKVEMDSRSAITLELYSGYDRGIYILDDNALWQYSFSGETPTPVLKWADSNVGMTGYAIDALGLLPEGELYLMAHQPGEAASLVEITFRDRAEIPEKQTVTLSLDWSAADSLSGLVGDFNRQSAEYEVEILSLDGLEDYDALNISLIKGEGPDLFGLTGIGIPNFAAKGIFEDLTPYFEQSSAVGKSDIIPSILDAWTMDGKTICVFPSFNIRGFLVKKGTTDQGGWTPDEYIRLAEENPGSILTSQDPNFFHDKVFYNSIYADLPGYADWQTGECHLDSEGFISMIERIQRLKQPELTQTTITTYDGKVLTYNVTVIGQDENDFYNGLLLTRDVTISGLPGYENALEYGDYAEIAGYPTQSGEPFYDMMIHNAIAINSASQAKDGAWAFLEFMLSEPYQSSLDYFPVRQDSFGKYLTRTEFNRGNTIVSFTGEELDALRELVAHVHWTATTTGHDMLPLITEEIEAVWAGQKSPADAAHIMQNRVSLFLGEQR